MDPFYAYCQIKERNPSWCWTVHKIDYAEKTMSDSKRSTSAALKLPETSRIDRARSVFWLGMSSVLFFFFSYLAFRHEPWPGAFGTELSGRWWRTLMPNSIPSLPLYNVRFNAVTNLPGTNTFIAVGSGGGVARSRDGGGSWEFPIWTGRATDFLNDVSFADASTGWAVGIDGVILRTDDGGTS